MLGFNDKVNREDIPGIFKAAGLQKVKKERRTMIEIGCDLCSLYYQDVVYMANPNTSDDEAERRLRQRRMEL